MKNLPPLEWIKLCRDRIVQLDSTINAFDAQSIALSMLTTERLRKLLPTEAVDLVASQIGAGQRTHFERRTVSRQHGGSGAAPAQHRGAGA